MLGVIPTASRVRRAMGSRMPASRSVKSASPQRLSIVAMSHPPRRGTDPAQPCVGRADADLQQPMHRPGGRPTPRTVRGLDHPSPTLAALDDAQALLRQDGPELGVVGGHRGRVPHSLGDPPRGPGGAPGDLLHLVLGVGGFGTVVLVERQGQQGRLGLPGLPPQGLDDGPVEPPRDEAVPP